MLLFFKPEFIREAGTFNQKICTHDNSKFLYPS